MPEETEMTPEELLAKQEADAEAAEAAALKEKEEKEAAEKKAAEELAKKRAQEEAAEKARLAAERAAKEEAERKAAEEAARKAKAEAEAKAAAEKAAAEAKKAEEAKQAAAAKPIDIEKAAAPKVIIVRPAVRKAAPVTSARRVAAVKTITDEVSESMSMHTPAGRALIRKFDEYAELCKRVRKDNQSDISKCAHKLYEIVVDCCPHNGSRNAGYYRELIMIVFKRLSQGYGKLFTDANLFRGDYNLPSPTDSMKFDAFWSAMYQLVEASKTGARITFNVKTLGQILKSESAMAVIKQLRARLESIRDN